MNTTADETTRVVDRDQLTKRVIPRMTLSDGSASSATSAPISVPYVEPKLAATQRFAVTGNAIITGGKGTLGQTASRALLQHGLDGLMIFDLDITQSKESIDALRVEFPSTKIEALDVDVTDEERVGIAVAETARVLGSVDILLCFAGVVGSMHAIDTPASQWRKIIDINTTGSFLCAQAAARQMIIQRSGGSITFVASISAHRVNYPQPQVAYNVSKAALLTLKSCLAAEWARYGIRTNSISPGYMDTILNEGEGLADFRKIWAERNPTGRMGTPNELTGAVLLLSSAAGTYVNGADIVVDGGATVF